MNLPNLRLFRILPVALAFALMLVPAGLSQAAHTSTAQALPKQDGTPVTLSCPFGGPGDGLDRGFYVDNFDGNRLDAVTMQYTADTAGTFSVEMIAREDTYDGPVIGTATITYSYPVADADVFQTFDFGGAPVNSDTITFEQVVLSAPTSSYFYYAGSGSIGDSTIDPCPGIVQTAGTDAPLDTFRRNTVGVTIEGRSVDTGTGTSTSTGPAPGCRAEMTIPDSAVGGQFVTDSRVYWKPGFEIPGVVIAAGNTARVLGMDSSGQYYKIIWHCDHLWVPVSAMGPNPDAVWNNAPLPATVVE